MSALVIFFGLLLVPAVEIYVIILVGGLIGGWPTFGLLAAGCLLGAWLIRREGRRAWRTLNEALSRGVMPERGLGDAGTILGGGALLLFPGFVTDVVGLLFVLPFTRPLLRRLLAGYAARRTRVLRERAGSASPGGTGGFEGPADRRADSGPAPGTPVVRGEVIHENPPEDKDT